MSVAETIRRTPETASAPEYTHRSFEMVFTSFCSKYGDRLEEMVGPGINDDKQFLGLPAGASVQQMGARLGEVSQAMGEAPRWDSSQEGDIDIKEALLLSARYLAWNAVMGGLTQKYLRKVSEYIDNEKQKVGQNGAHQHNIKRLNHEKKAAVSIMLAQNHALRDYFDSGLAKTLGNDSPEHMDSLLSHVPVVSEVERKDLVKGISLEIAVKRNLEDRQKLFRNTNYQVAYGTDAQDARGGDIVLTVGDETLFIDVKSKMPRVFSNRETSTPLDDERGYKWIEGGADERKVVVWAYQKDPVRSSRFLLTDARMSESLGLTSGAVVSWT